MACSDYSMFNCSKTDPAGEIRHAYLVQKRCCLDDFSPVLASVDEEVTWTLGFGHIALFPILLAKHNSLLFVKHVCIPLMFYWYLKPPVYLLAPPRTGIEENTCPLCASTSCS